MMLVQEVPAETFNFMILGFVVILGVMGVYLISLYVRSRQLDRDLEFLREIEADEQP